MDILFLVALNGSRPVGGLKVVYEYANQLARRSHRVRILHTVQVLPRGVPVGVRGRLRILEFLPMALSGKWKPDKWFKLDSNVELIWIPTLSRMFLPRADIYVATWWTTAERLMAWRDLPGRKLYLIQHLETWQGLVDQVMSTWKGPLEKIVIARWLADIAHEIGETCHYIPNGLDFTQFGCDSPPQTRDPHHIAMLFSSGVTWKGSVDGLAAVLKLKEKYPDLKAEFFGLEERDKKLPGWIVYHQTPAQEEIRRIYNRASIFFAPSHSEGWGLPPCEAMMCGTAVVATDIGGHQEFCENGENAILVPPKNPEALALAASTLIDDSEMRLRIAESGRRSIGKFTWGRACDAFERVMANDSR
jgi:glycosyltransferase involved in cell wall biosynthesis